MRTIFWNVDTQYDFMRDDEEHKGTLAIPGAKGIEDRLQALTELAAEENITVVNTADWHTKQSKEISDNPDYKTTFPRHCMVGTKGAEYVPATFPRDHLVVDWNDTSLDEDEVMNWRNIVLYKDHFDVFQGNPHTERVLSLLKPDRAVVYGVATNVCVNYAVKGLLARGIAVDVPVDAIKELPGLPLEAVLQDWERNGARLTTTEEIVGRYHGTR